MGRQTDTAWINFRGLDCLWFMAIPSLRKNDLRQSRYYDNEASGRSPYDRGLRYKYMGKIKMQGTSEKKMPKYSKEGENAEGDVLFTFSHDLNIGKEDRIVVRSWKSRQDEIFTSNGQSVQQLGFRFIPEALYLEDEDENVYTPTIDFKVISEFTGEARIEWITTPPVAGKELAFMYNSYPIYIIDTPGKNRSFGGTNSTQLLRNANGFLWDPRSVSQS